MGHHNAYSKAAGASSAPQLGGAASGGEPGPAPTMRELMEKALEGRVDSDPQVT